MQPESSFDKLSKAIGQAILASLVYISYMFGIGLIGVFVLVVPVMIVLSIAKHFLPVGNPIVFAVLFTATFVTSTQIAYRIAYWLGLTSRD